MKKRVNRLRLVVVASCCLVLPLQAVTASGVSLFKDWAVACNNVRHCEAASFLLADYNAEGVSDSYTATLELERGAGAKDAVSIKVSLGLFDDLPEGLSGKPVVLKAGEQRLSLGSFTDQQLEDRAIGVPEDLVLSLLEMMRQPAKLEVFIGDKHFEASLKGLSASLLYMDEKQERLDTPSALIRKGNKTMTASAPELPILKPVLPGSQRKVPDDLIDKITPLAAKYCEDDFVGESIQGQAYLLDDAHFLVLVPCWMAAYNSASVAFVVAADSASLETPTVELAKIADPEKADGFVEAAEVAGAVFDPAEGSLSSWFKGRGVGDCGVSAKWVWTGQHFTLFSREEMPECRGQIEWLNVWDSRF